MSNIRLQQAICRSAELGAAALAIAPDPAVTPGGQGLRLVPIAEGYGHHPELEDVLLTLTFEQLAEAWAKVQQLKKPEFRQPLIAVAGAEVGLGMVSHAA